MKDDTKEDAESNSKRVKSNWSADQLNNNFGQCPYCPRNGFRHVMNHIGKAHTCRKCRNLDSDCNCYINTLKNDLFEFLKSK